MKATRNVMVRLVTPNVPEEYPIEAQAEIRGEWATHHELLHTSAQVSVGINGTKSQIYGYSAEWGKLWKVSHAPTGLGVLHRGHSYREACALASCLAERVPPFGGSFGTLPNAEALEPVLRVLQDLELAPKGQ